MLDFHENHSIIIMTQLL